MGAEMTAAAGLRFRKKATVTYLVHHLLHLLHPSKQVQSVVKLITLKAHIMEENIDGTGGPGGALIGSLVFLLLLLIATLVLLIGWFWKKTQEDMKDGTMTPWPPIAPRPRIPSQVPDVSKYAVLDKGASMKGAAAALAGNRRLLENEFRRITDYALCTVTAVKTTEISMRNENTRHNRYRDILPYDDNIVELRSSEFSVPGGTNYINASPIAFENCSQSFIACQAPKKEKENGFDHFWHLIVQEEVKKEYEFLNETFGM
jgi:hypothetical protein